VRKSHTPNRKQRQDEQGHGYAAHLGQKLLLCHFANEAIDVGTHSQTRAIRAGPKPLKGGNIREQQ